MKVKQIYEESKKKMEQAKEALVKRYTTMRGGRARADLVSEIKVECYGSRMPLKQLSNISVPEPRLIVIEPWDKSLIKNIEKAILNSSLGINPTNDGSVIRLVIPTLTEERREELAKVVRQWAEEARISVRNIRREAREKIEKLEKEKEISEDEKRRAQKEIQALTDDVMEEI
ncbi:MAG TPA: ribosome recycling factor, partial [Candidatus Aerophobetes bacterium]|nr:ribosome recycling factor [Candidatus Aerophobetes bacterium]